MSKVFLSYHQKDEPFARELYHRLTRDGVECFFDKESIAWGEAGFKKQIRPLLLEACDDAIPQFFKPILFIDVSSNEKFEKNYPALQEEKGFLGHHILSMP